MVSKNIQIDIRLVWALVIADIANTIFVVYTRNSEIGSFSFVMLITLSLVLQVILISDIIKNKLFNKSFWLLSMIFIPKLAQIFYLMQRGKLIRLGNKLAKEETTAE
jgi:glucose uptake protein GlcU